MATKPLPEPPEGREGAQQRHEIERERARRRQAAAGFDPRAHLQDVTVEGDRSVFSEWLQIERQRPKGMPLEQWAASILARWDMTEIAHAAWEREWKLRQAARVG